MKTSEEIADEFATNNFPRYRFPIRYEWTIENNASLVTLIRQVREEMREECAKVVAKHNLALSGIQGSGVYIDRLAGLAMDIRRIQTK